MTAAALRPQWVELREMGRLAWPIVLSNLASSSLTTVDVMMVGRCGPGPLAVIAFGVSVSFFISFIGFSSLNLISSLVARAEGAGPGDEAGHAFRHGVWFSLLLAVPTTLVLLHPEPVFRVLAHTHPGGGPGPYSPNFVPGASEYARLLALGIPFHFATAACLNALRGLARVMPGLVVMLAANGVNAVGNWALIFGHLGFRAMGPLGSAWATSLTRVAMLVASAAYIASQPELRKVLSLRGFFRPSPVRLWSFFSHGLPIGLRSVLDYGIFTVVVVLMGRLGPVPLAANQIAFDLMVLGLMLPLGVSAATSIRVGRFAAGRDGSALRRAVRGPFALTLGLASLTGACYLIFPGALARLYSQDAAVVSVATGFIRLCAVFLVLDAAGTFALYMLQAVLDTRIPSLANVSAYWGLCLPLAWMFAFSFRLGGPGLWLGLCVGNAVLALFLLRRGYRTLVAVAIS